MKEIFSRNQLKMLAVLTMLCDHIAVIFVPEEFAQPLRGIGRIAFPIFAYFIAQGFLYTSNYKKYVLRVGVFALLSEIPFDLAFQGTILEFQSQNVMFTMLIGLVMLYFLRRWEYSLGMKAILLLAGCVCGWFFRVDYSWFGVLLIGMFYLLRTSSRGNQMLVFVMAFFFYGGLEVLGLFGVLCVLFHRKEKESWFFPKYFFYIFYPAHLLILWGIAMAGKMW